MAESAHAYVRGNTTRFYEWLKSDKVQGTVPEGPEIWICGDCHIGNLAPVADVGGNIEIQIRDLDQTVIGNPAHDLLRLALSLAMAARSSDLPGVTTALMLEEMIGGYIAGLGGRRSKVRPGDVAPIQTVMREAKGRGWKHLARERIENAEPIIPLGKRFWPLSKSEQSALQAMVKDEDLQHLVRTLSGKETKHIKMLDAAYWMKGCSSLGRLRYALLLSVGRSHKDGYRLLDVKEAVRAAAPRSATAPIPRNNAERVVAGATALSPFLGERMLATTLNGYHVVIRELRPEDLKFDFAGLAQRDAVAIARLLASVVGRAHGRQMDLEARRSWIDTLGKRQTTGMEAPCWLWSSVVDLVALHEAAYLEHCRRYALNK
jgi:uncharacterized protein (DUF2252 family)